MVYSVLIYRERKAIYMDGDSSDADTAFIGVNIINAYEVYPLYVCMQAGCAFLCHKKLRM